MSVEPDSRIDAIAYRVIGAALEMHRTLGPGFLESVYQAAFACELSRRRIRFEREKTVPLFYTGIRIGEHRLDFPVEESVVVELKTVEALNPVHTSQMISYLVATRLPIGLLINFHVPMLKDGITRIVLS